MRPRSLAPLLALSALAAITLAARRAPTPFALLVAAERAFARMATDSGTHLAFVHALGDDATLFRPRAVPGRQWMLAHPPTGDQGRLEWGPDAAAVASSGDLGFTTGRWTLTRTSGADTARGYGRFSSVWARDPGQPWRLLVDLGVGDTLRLPPDVEVPVQQVPVEGHCTDRRAAEARRVALLAADSLLASTWADTSATSTGLAGVAAPELRVLRNGRPMLTGPAGARATVARVGAARYAGAPISGRVSRAGDLGFTIGTYTFRNGDATVGAGNYMRVWRCEGTGWALLLDVAEPVPPGA